MSIRAFSALHEANVSSVQQSFHYFQGRPSSLVGFSTVHSELQTVERLEIGSQPLEAVHHVWE